VSITERLEKLRLKRGLTWDKLGEELELSRAMLHYVRKNERELSERALFRLAAAERAAGIEPPPIKHPGHKPNAEVMHDSPPSPEEFQDTLKRWEKLADTLLEKIMTLQNEIKQRKK
jgi:transcriptional regulator with XRE-family HTH domain